MNAAAKHSEIEQVTGLKATDCHLKGEVKIEKTGKTWGGDMWLLESPLPEEDSLSDHLYWLAEQILPHLDYFLRLKESGVELDIFCGYRSNCWHAGFEVEHEALELFTKLKVPFGISVISPWAEP
jgi:hypothetical protein